MQISRLTDFIYAYRLLNILQKPWIEQDAYKYGIIDDNGNLLRKWATLSTAEEKNAFSYFHRIAFNLKRLLDRVPGMESSRALRVAAALRLLKEETGHDFDEKMIQYIGEKLAEETPTNVTGSAIGAPVDRPLNPKAKVLKRPDAEGEIKE